MEGGPEGDETTPHEEEINPGGKTNQKDPTEEEMDTAIADLDKKTAPITLSSDKRDVKDEFKFFELNKVRTPTLDILFSALKTIQPTSTEGLFYHYLHHLKFHAGKIVADEVSKQMAGLASLFP